MTLSPRATATSTNLKSLLLTIGKVMMFTYHSNFLLGVSAIDEVKVGDKICTIGYIMDNFCIQRGTLFDNKDVATLGSDGPIVHSVHCLIDVPSCISSPWEILLDAKDVDEVEEAYGRAFQAESNTLLINYAKMVGDCKADGCTGTQKMGLKATVMGEVATMGNSKTPITLDITEVKNAATGCPAVDGVKVLTNLTDVPSKIAKGESPAKNLNRIYIAHGALMMIGWGLLLPAGAIIAKLTKYYPNAFWFKAHISFQVTGLICALIAFILILMNSNALGDKGSGSLNYPHAVMGVLTMTLGLFQPLNALLRPHVPENGAEKTTIRKVWEIVHKGVGWSVLILAVVTIGFGTTLLPTRSQQTIFQVVYGAGVGGLLLGLACHAHWNKPCSDD